VNGRARGDGPALGRASRILAGVLAAVWVGAGALVLASGIARREWRPALVGAAGVLFGLLWVRVARTGRYVAWPRRR
jgi:hypothetical protein